MKEYGFVGAHFYPHWFNEAPDSAVWYPYYARCAELNIPVMMQVGHCLVYQKDRRLERAGVTRPDDEEFVYGENAEEAARRQ